MTPVKIILGILILLSSRFLVIFIKDYVRFYREGKLEKVNIIFTSILAFIVNFLDALGIGSYASSTAVFKFTGMVKDKQIPGTLNVATMMPVLFQALIFITIIQVDIFTMITIIVCTMIGSYIGASIVSKLPERKIQIGMGFGLFAVAITMVLQILNIMPPGGNVTYLSGIKLGIAWVGAFILGITNCIGIGVYAPMMALLLSLGMSPIVIFPIMMGSCAFFQTICGTKFVQEGQYNRQVSMIYSTVGVVGVLVAAYIVKTLPVEILKKLVVAVVIYTSANMFRSAFKSPKHEIEEIENVEPETTHVSR
ncbi:sulfite exporter TauE/SafE family protein [Clostridium formicaceticum]|uniref:Probable membrane transporter protein n=1 Tax=Clostridium formicaceticum TaxID=1497 RepID=A0AAC9RMS4_9CLOT|nr:sulfite exporter TauE/SafE family protein [Clostridium formicaceticum]AOY77860.1 permease [Clostridium formicaceticum]ARE88477.1 Sulfite exporter TauE/SafE [Clostridium formicaceticum]